MGTGPQANKTIVMGIVQRKGRKGKVRAFIVPGSYGSTLRRKVRDHVEEGATIYTDAWPAYADLQRDYKHYVVNHAIEYARGHVHTNSIESFWAVLKRALKGTYIAPRPWHLQKYVEEEVFRFNERENTDGPRFALAAKGADGKRLTYRELVAQGRVGRANRK
jgi:transposase-like protein